MKLPESIHKKLDEAVEGVRSIPKLLNTMMDLLQVTKELKAKVDGLEKIIHEKIIMDKEKKLIGDEEEVPQDILPRPYPLTPPLVPQSPTPPWSVGPSMYGPATPPGTGGGIRWGGGTGSGSTITFTTPNPSPNTSGLLMKVENALTSIKEGLTHSSTT